MASTRGPLTPLQTIADQLSITFEQVVEMAIAAENRRFGEVLPDEGLGERVPVLIAKLADRLDLGPRRRGSIP